jgi:RNA recognition motif-containing protein
MAILESLLRFVLKADSARNIEYIVSLRYYIASGSLLMLSRIAAYMEKRCNLMETKLYVGNLSFEVTDQELEQLFSQYGEVVSATVIRDRDTDRSRGFGFVEFSQKEDAQKAKEEMNGKEFTGRALRIDEAREPKSRDRRSRGYGSNRRERY